MDPLIIGQIALAGLVAAILLGIHIPIAFLSVSSIALFALRGDIGFVAKLVALSINDTAADYSFGVIPLFILMGLLVVYAGMGRDAYTVAASGLRRLPGSLGVATVFSNAIFASITGVSVASASVFTRLAIPEMRNHGYSLRFSLGVVAGSSVLGMLIPPSLLFIVYGLLTEVSIGKLFLAGVVPGVLLSIAFLVVILAWTLLRAQDFGKMSSEQVIDLKSQIAMIFPIALLIFLVMGSLFSGLVTATESGAIGVAGAFVIAVWKRGLDMPEFWKLLQTAGVLTTNLLLLIISAGLFSRMLVLCGLPAAIGDWFMSLNFSQTEMVLVFVLIILVLGCLMDSASILFLTVPIALPVFQALGTDLIWLGVITVLAVEVGLLTPPLGLAAFVVKGALPSDIRASVGDIFIGSAPFVLAMVCLIAALIAAPWLILR